MAEGMAKSVAPSTPRSVPQQGPVSDGLYNAGPNIHPEIYRFFSLNPSDVTNIDQLEAVSSWAGEGSKGIGQTLRNLRGLERKLGQPRLDETRVSQMFNWVRMTNSIKATRGEMNKQLKTIQDTVKNTVANMRGNYNEKIGKVDAEIKRLTSERNKAIREQRQSAASSMEKARKEYASQLKELHSMREAYKGGK